MGCDIHIVLERRKKTGAEWIGVWASDELPDGRPKIAQRDYDFFAAVAGVRGRPENTDNYPRNIPEDVSRLAWQQYMHSPTDHHSASHMTAAEFVATHQKVNPHASRAGFGAYDLLHIHDDYDDEGGRGYEYRVVFWFDN